MIKDRKTTIGYHCPFCGSSILNRVNIFSMSNKLLKLKCPCVESELSVQIMKDNRIRLTVPCIICPVTHSFTLSSNIFFKKDLFYLTCTFTAIGICFFGRSEKVINAMKENEEELIKMFSAYDDEYNAEEYMYKSGFSKLGDESANRDNEEEDDDDDDDDLLDDFEFFLDDDEDENDDYIYVPSGKSDINSDKDKMDWDNIMNNLIGLDTDGSIFKGMKKKGNPSFEVYRGGESDKNTKAKTKKEDTTIGVDEKILIDRLKIKSPAIFEKILNIIYSLINEKKVYCLCDSKDEFDGEMTIKEDKIILKCKNCEANRTIKASSPSDLEYFYDIDELYLD